MPTTYNGIGTHYYGKRNFEERVGDCRICGRTVNLRSYDTRLWFVIFFVPVIPMGRKRIVDFCPACTRHFAVDADKWETAKQLNISGAMEKFRTNPTPESAIEAHRQLMNYHQGAQAAEFQQTMTAQFPDNAKIQTYLGYVLVDSAKPEQAASFFERALQLRPDLPEAKVGLARVHLRAGRLDAARKLLSFLETPGAAQLYSLEPLETLANAYQGREQHADALDLYGKLLTALPAIGEHGGFRKRVQKSEKALKREGSILPKTKFSWRKLFQYQRTGVPTAQFRFTRRGLAIAGAVAAVAAVILALVNENIRRHRKLYIVSGFKDPVTVTVRGFSPVRLRLSEQELVLPEGRHHAAITGAVREEVDFDIRAAGYFSRFFDDPAWLLNAGGSALIMYRSATYSHNPHPPAVRFYFGRNFEYLPSITHPFKELPETVYLKSSEERTYTQLQLLRDPPAGVFYHYTENGNGAEALRLAEWRLRLQPDDEHILSGYGREAEKLKQAARAETFLRAGLSNRPVVVEWHREYQRLCRKHGQESQLADEYAAMLAADPTNSALIYLRGRSCSNDAEALTWFERARVLDPANPFPNYALGYHHLTAGDWARARPFLARAYELRPDDDSFHYWFWLTQLALGEFNALEQDLRDRLKRNPLDIFRACSLPRS